MNSISYFVSVLSSFPTAVPGISKLPVLMQALLRAHRERPGCPQTHQGEEAQEEHHGTRTCHVFVICFFVFWGFFFPQAIHVSLMVFCCGLWCLRRSRRRTSCGPCLRRRPRSSAPWTRPSWRQPRSTASPRKTLTSAAQWSPAWRRSSRSTWQVGTTVDVHPAADADNDQLHFLGLLCPCTSGWAI